MYFVLYFICTRKRVFILQKCRGEIMGKNEKKKKEEVVKESFYKQVKAEMKKVKWPTRKEMFKYSITTLAFIVIFTGFFYLIDVLFALLKGLVG